MIPKPIKLLLFGALFIVSSLNLQAFGIYAWSGAVSTDYNTAANWSTNSVPGASDFVQFNNTPTANQPVVSTANSVNSINFTTSSGGWTLSGSGPLTMTGTSGIGASGQTSGINTVSVASVIVASGSSVAKWTIFGTGTASTASTFNLSSSIQLTSSGQFYLFSQRSTSGSGVGTVNLSGAISGTSAGGVKFGGNSYGKSTFNISGAGGSSSYTGPTAISQTTLNFDQLANDGSSSSFGSSGVVTLGDNASFALVNYTGTGGSTDRPWVLGSASGGTGGGGFKNNGTGPVSFNNTGLAVAGVSGNRRLELGGTYTGSPNTFSELITNNGAGFFTAFFKNDAGTWILANPNNGYFGTNTLNAGTLQVSKLDNGGSPSSIGASSSAAQNVIFASSGALTPTLAYIGAGDSSDRLFQMSYTNATINNDGSGALNFTGSGTILQAGTNPRTLILGGSYVGDANTFSPSLQDGPPGAVSLTKKGAGTWMLTGANTYSGATTVSAGTLLINGSLGSTTVTVASGATLGGSGTIGGPVTILDGGNLALGDTIGTLTINNALSLSSASTTAMKLSKSGVALSSDLIQGVSTVTYGGTLNVTASGDALAAGDTFQLFNAGAYSGSFGAINLPALGGSLSWNTSGLSVDGSIRVVSSGGTAPIVSVDPASTNAECGASVTFTATASGDPTPALQWYDNNGSAIPSATGNTFTLNNVHAAQNGSWTVVAANSAGTATNSASLVVVDTTPPTITCPGTISVVTTDPAGANVSFSVSASDTCDGSPSVVSTPASGSLFAAGTNTVTATATDVGGNINSCSFQVIVDRAPVVQTNLSASLMQDQALTLELTNLLAVASDPDNDSLIVTAAGPTSTNGGTVMLTGTNVIYQPVAGYTGADLLSYVIGDGRGGLATNTVAVTVYSSNVLSVAISPASTNAECGSSVSFTATTSSELSPSFQWYDNAGNLIADATTATLTLTDIHAAQSGSWKVVMVNSLAQATNSASLVVVDTIAPVLTLNGANPMIIECHSVFSDPGATALDACMGVLSVSVSGSVNTEVLGVYTLSYSADDGNGNISHQDRTVQVVDTTAPVITCPGTIAVVTTEPAGANVSFTVTATDNYDANPSVVSTPASGSFFAAGTNTVVATATDSSGNSDSCSFQVIVDRAPVVRTNETACVAQNQLLSIGLVKLLALASDPDNDPLTVTAAGPTSTNGGTVTLSGSTVTYLPTANFIGDDLFSYTISDGRGGLATNTVLVSVVSSNGLSPNVVFGPVLTNGQIVVRFAGIPGYTYTIEATDNLTTPDWTKKVNLTAPLTDQGLGVGIFEFSETVGTAPAGFYRTVYPAR